MAAERLLKRVHGGALPLAPELPDFSARRGVSPDVKRQLGAFAAKMVRPGRTVFLDGGTTTAEIARHLPRNFTFTVVTHSPTIAGELEHHPTAEVILIGGKLYKHSMVATGAAANGGNLAGAAGHLLPRRDRHPSRSAVFRPAISRRAAIKRHIAQCSAETYVMVTQGKRWMPPPLPYPARHGGLGHGRSRSALNRGKPGALSQCAGSYFHLSPSATEAGGRDGHPFRAGR